MSKTKKDIVYIEKQPYRISTPLNNYTSHTIIVGKQSCGKSALVQRICNNIFDENINLATIGADFTPYSIIGEENTVKMKIWDVSGDEKYIGAIKGYMVTMHMALIVYDVTSRKTFDGIDKWYDMIKQYCEKDIIIFLVGNKTDKRIELKSSKVGADEKKKKSIICTAEGEEKAKSLGVCFIETSAKTGENVAELLKMAADKIIQKRKLDNEKAKISMVDDLSHIENTNVISANHIKVSESYCFCSLQ